MEDRGEPLPSDERRATLLFAAILAVWGVFWAISSSRIPIRATVLAPGVLPFWMGLILTFLACILLVLYWRRPSRPPAELDREPMFPEWRISGRLIALMGALLVYIIALPTVHYLLNTFLLMVVALALFGERLKPRLVIVAAAISLFLFEVFPVLLDIPLPGSRFG